jgi:hypothetical protein
MATVEDSDEIFQLTREGFDESPNFKDDFAQARRRPNRRCSVTEHVIRAQQEYLNKMAANTPPQSKAYSFESQLLLPCHECTDSTDSENAMYSNGTANGDVLVPKYFDSCEEAEENPAVEAHSVLHGGEVQSNKHPSWKIRKSAREKVGNATDSSPSSKPILLRLWPRRTPALQPGLESNQNNLGAIESGLTPNVIDTDCNLDSERFQTVPSNSSMRSSSSYAA